MKSALAYVIFLLTGGGGCEAELLKTEDLSVGGARVPLFEMLG